MKPSLKELLWLICISLSRLGSSLRGYQLEVTLKVPAPVFTFFFLSLEVGIEGLFPDCSSFDVVASSEVSVPDFEASPFENF